jgi:mannose-6-phosphate isomerase-like protein (cupin superfamily)
MAASTFKLKTPEITGGRSHIPLAKTEHMTVGLNYYTPGRKNKLHTHPGEDHIFLVMDGQATFYNKDHHATILNRGEGIMLPEKHYYYFQSTGDRPLALFRVSAKKGNKPAVLRVDSEGNKRTDEEVDFVVVDGQVVGGRFPLKDRCSAVPA